MDKITDLMNSLKLESGCDQQPISIKDYEQMKVDRYNASVGNLNESDGYECEACKNKGFTAELIFNDQFQYYTDVLKPCKCMKARNAIRRLEASGLKNVVKKYTFESYRTPNVWQKTILKAAIAFCSASESKPWFFIGGQSGSGKTHICTAIAVKYLKMGNGVKYMLWRDEITKIKALVNDPEEYGRMMNDLKTADVLYIDDLFKGGKDELGNYKRPTEADVKAAFEVINYRYNNSLVTIISSERTLQELNDIDEAIAGRIAEKSKEGGFCFTLMHDPSKNWRMNGITEL